MFIHEISNKIQQFSEEQEDKLKPCGFTRISFVIQPANFVFLVNNANDQQHQTKSTLFNGANNNNWPKQQTFCDFHCGRLAAVISNVC